jgi:hypothetical protein
MAKTIKITGRVKAKKVPAKPKKKKALNKQINITKGKIAFASGSKIFEVELNLLDKVQNDLFESITLKPDVRDVEAVRLYVDNLYLVLNRAVTIIMDVKNHLIKKDIPASITETYNSPA